MIKKLLNSLFISVSLLLLSASTAYAYLDSGTGSIVLQMLFAGVAGCLALLKIYWHKFTTMLNTFFKKKPLPITHEQTKKHDSQN